MPKRKFFQIIILALLLLVPLSGCKSNRLTGSYVCKEDKSVSLAFSGEGNVTFHDGNGDVVGSYTVIDDSVFILLPEDVNWPVLGLSSALSEMILEIENNKTLSAETAGVTVLLFNKQGIVKIIWSKYWKQIIIAFVVLGIIGTISETLDEIRDKRKKD